MQQQPCSVSSMLGYRQLLATMWQTAESEEPYNPPPTQDHPSEHLLHGLWMQQRFLRQPLTTLDDRVVTVYRPGRGGRSHGPDFQEAKLRFGDGPLQVGDVEMHTWASDWMRHGHDQDPAYTKVLLHVVWRNDSGALAVVNAYGNAIPQLELATFVEMTLAELRESLDEEGLLHGQMAAPTPCQRSLHELPAETIGRLLDMAGEERWRQKATRFALKADRRGVEQALYESVLEALGFRGNRMPFWQLARLAPVARLREVPQPPQPSPLGMQAILYGVSGFLRCWHADRKQLRPDSRAYVELLLSHWDPVSAWFPEQIDPRYWRTAGIRPANFPQRRIAAAGYLLEGLGHHSLMDRLLAPLRELPAQAPRHVLLHRLRQLVQRLRITGASDYWRHRYALDRPPTSRPIDLLGPGRAATLVIDVLLPAAAALARLGHESIPFDAVRSLYLCHPRLPANEVIRAMMQQFFGADRERAAVVNSACRQQALLQLYRDFCLNEQEACQECAFPRLAARLSTVQTDRPPAEP